MERGFSLIELMITIVVMTILLAVVAPSMGYFNEKAKMQRLANELSGFLIQARSEAVMQNKTLYLSFLPNTPLGSAPTTYDGKWGLALRASSAIPGSLAAQQNNAEMYLSGMAFKNMTISTNNHWPALDSVNGRPEGGSNSEVTFSIDTEKKLKIIQEGISGRVNICGVGGDLYGYPGC
ncbi:GspH/FimT family pseudopilin [Vibrio algicola]|uniref:Type II secretion system protein H n=1 Tax=Vibrio algicola TaxID=2662262 RepID=A0A5Q0TF07_9VIBR|nr:GspH/FimT family pseudopilin [Vibrio algicola]